VIETKHKVLDSEGRLSIDLASGGNGYLFQRGKVIEVTWKNVDGVIQAFKDGEQMKLYPGKTWVNIVQDLNGVSYQ
jgi:glucose-6-phosphate 1-dehydrogenase